MFSGLRWNLSGFGRGGSTVGLEHFLQGCWFQSVKMCDQENSCDEDVDVLLESDKSEPEQQLSRAPFDPELDDDDDDDDDVDDGGREAVVLAPLAQTSFSLRGGSSVFSDRSHSVFDCLDTVTQLTSSSLNQDQVIDSDFVQPQPPGSSKKVSQPPSTSSTKKRGVPDYLVHPERWIHYSLEGVTETSDQDNRTAAINFLSSLQQERQSDSFCNVQQRMIFSRPNRQLKEKTAEQLSAVRGKKRGMHLSHLEEGEEEGTEGRKRDKDRQTEQREEETKDIDMRRAVGPEKEEQQMLKEKGEEVKLSFTPFRKTKSKNYRRSSEKEDD